MRVLLLLASALLASSGSFCAAAPKVGIRIVPRDVPEVVVAPAGPVPYRVPHVYWQGPFASAVESYVDPLPCVKATPVTIDATAALLDVCHLKNVTLVKQPPVVAPDTDSDESVDPAGAEEAVPDMRKILGIYRGWKMDPITRRYKQMIFDDGDECGTEYGNRMSTVIDIVAATNPSATPRVYDVQQLDACRFRAKLFAYVPLSDLVPTDSVHTPGVLDIAFANETLPQVCAQIKCRYNTIVNKVHAVRTQVAAVNDVTNAFGTTLTPALANMTLRSSKAILQASNAVLERSLELLATLEALQRQLQLKLDTAAQRETQMSLEVDSNEAKASHGVDAPSDAAARDDDHANDSISHDVDEHISSEDSDEQDASSDEKSTAAMRHAADSVREVVVDVQS